MEKHEQLKEIIHNWKDWISNRHSYIDRNNYKNIKLSKSFARAIIGVRRSGKTTIALQNALRISKNVCYINFEDPFFYSHNDFHILDEIPKIYKELYKLEPKVIVLDEVHNINGWEKWLRKIIDTEKYTIIITGSSAKLLSSEISTSLTGRCLESKVFPLSFMEYIDFKNIKPKTENHYLKILEDYFVEGGFPRVVIEKDTALKKEFLKQYFQDLVYKDILMRYNIRDLNSLQKVISYYLTNISSKHSFRSIKNTFDINVSTAQEYASYCESAFLFSFIKKYDRNLKVQNKNPQKVYCIDSGLRSENAFSHSKDYGKIAENIVFIELLRRGLQVFYHQEKYEVDFLIVENLKPTFAINVTYSDLRSLETREREIESMIECLSIHHLDEGLILTKNLERVEEYEGKKITFLPVYKFLLDYQFN